MYQHINQHIIKYVNPTVSAAGASIRQWRLLTRQFDFKRMKECKQQTWSEHQFVEVLSSFRNFKSTPQVLLTLVLKRWNIEMLDLRLAHICTALPSNQTIFTSFRSARSTSSSTTASRKFWVELFTASFIDVHVSAYF